MRIRDAEKEELVKIKAIEIIGKDGFEGFSINKLAKICEISVATLYIYYKDKDDLIKQIALEQATLMSEAMLKDFDPESSLEDGLRQQWINRYEFMRANPHNYKFYEQLKSSAYYTAFVNIFKEKAASTLGNFIKNITSKGEMDELPFEVYWAIAFGPLYSLIKFHNDGHSVGGFPFKLTDEIFNKTLELAIKALKK